MPQCLVSFGSNLGTRQSLLAAAVSELSRITAVTNFRVSRLYESPPIGGPSGQDPFLNGVAAFDTDARALQVLGWLQDLENRLGRRREKRWGARSIDLDVVLHGNLIGGSSDLTVPHPRYTARRFVLLPACDVAADYRDPRFGWTLGRLTDHLAAGNASMALAGGDAATRAELCRRLREDCLASGRHSGGSHLDTRDRRFALGIGDGQFVAGHPRGAATVVVRSLCAAIDCADAVDSPRATLAGSASHLAIDKYLARVSLGSG
jgi:2-amino-4-hydroxy-6-hydroxymethyldihydropteridine diphosphokinase